MEENRYIGKLNRSVLGKYKDKIVTDDIVLTAERVEHIFIDHFNDFDKIMKSIDSVVLNPDEILEDVNNVDTIFMIGKLDKNNLNVIVKLNTIGSKEHPQNSIMTAWIIRDKNLKKLRDKNITIYKKE